MTRTYEGSVLGEGRRVAVAVSRFNRLVTEPPLAVQRLARSGRYAAVVALGAVVRGATPHFDYVAGEAAAGLGAVARQTGVPVAFGVLTTDTMEQALDRAGGKAGNKGAEAALVALEMAGLLEAIDKDQGKDSDDDKD